MTHVLFAPHFDPAANRTSLEVPEGLTIAGIIAAAVPQLRDEDHQQLRVHVVGPRDSYIVPSALWPVCRPKQGMQVMLHLVPAGDGARAVLQTVVVVGAMALGQYWASALIPAAGVGQSLLAAGLTAGLSMVGNMLVNSLVPAQAVGLSSSRNSEAEATPSSYAINGWSNVARKGEPIPFALGQIRMAPPFGAGSYTEIYDDKQYVRTLFCFGYGPLEVDDIRIGDVPISEYDDVEIEIREGYESDEPVSLYPRQVIEDPDAGGVELVRNYPRDGSGQPDTSQTAELAPVVRLSATNATHATVIIGFPQGLFRIESNGDKRNEAVDIRIRQRLSDADEWQDVTTISVSQHRREAFYRAHTWELPSRGRWQIEVTRLTTEAVTGNSVPTRVSNTALAAIQSHRPEYPIAMSKPLTLVAVRCRATYQLNGQLDNLNAIVRRVSRDWDGSAWVMRASRNPAAAYVLALQGNQNPFPEPDSSIDWQAIQDWHEFCDLHGLKYDYVHESDEALGDQLRQICAAGRANPRHDGTHWTVVIDRVEDLVRDEVNPRNAGQFRWSRTYFDPPHAFRVPFIDETNEHLPAERIVPWPGHVGSIDLTETLELPGKTDPDEIWIEARRRQYELAYRADEVSCVQSGLAQAYSRGDQVAVSLDLLDRAQSSARVKIASGRRIQLDAEVELQAGVQYGCRFRVFDGDDDIAGSSVVVPLVANEGQTDALDLAQDSLLPDVGAVVHVGPMSRESSVMRVLAVEAGEAGTSVLRMVPSAPEIDHLTAAEVPPVWDPVAGDAQSVEVSAPAVPRFTSIQTGIELTGLANRVAVTIAPGAGAGSPVSSFQIWHRLGSAGAWTIEVVSAASASLNIDAYAVSDVVELCAVAVGFDGAESAVSAVQAVSVGATDVPDVLGDLSVTGSYGAARLAFTAPDDGVRTGIRVYRGDDTDFNAASDISGLVTVGTAGDYEIMVGDEQVNLVVNGAFNSVSNWQAAGGWSISGGAATHTPEDPVVDDALLQSLYLVPDETYVWAMERGTGAAGGDVSIELRGDTITSAVTSTGGAHFGTLAAPVNPAALAVVASDFDGSIDNISLRLDAAGALAPGASYIWVVAESAYGVQATLQGPFAVTIR